MGEGAAPEAASVSLWHHCRVGRQFCGPIGYGPGVPTRPRLVTDEATGPEGRATATFDPTRTYRYRLTRSWDPGRPSVNFLMLNPSTADARALDPTIRRCVGFARSWGFGAVEITNLFALRATDTKVLMAHREPVGPGNDRAILDAARRADRVVVAWGNHGAHDGRAEEVADLLDRRGVRPVALRHTVAGHPHHPLYVPGDVEPHEWVRATSA